MSLKPDSLNALNANLRGENIPNYLKMLNKCFENIAQKLVHQLEQDELFFSWKKNQPKSYLSHLFCQLSPEFKLLNNWEIGFYNPADNKITVFIRLEKGDFAIKPADDVFKEESSQIEELDQINKVTLGFEDVKTIFDSKSSEFFPKELFSNGFIILQKLNGKVMWNVTFITRTVKFANFKIDAENGEVISHDLINFVEKQLKKK